jgi:hypothetical protein
MRRPQMCWELQSGYLSVSLHLVQDEQLIRLLCTAGPGGDVFRLIASEWLRPASRSNNSGGGAGGKGRVCAAMNAWQGHQGSYLRQCSLR